MDQSKRRRNRSGRGTLTTSSGEEEESTSPQSDIQLFNNLLTYPLLTGVFFGIGYQLVFHFLKKKSGS